MINEASGSLAAEKLLRHIREKHGSIPKFCETKGIDRIKTQKAIKGELQRVDVHFAVDIQRATDGEVRVEDWSEGAAGDAA